MHYNPKLPFLLNCDASPYGIGPVLSDQMADGTDKPVAFASQTLAPAEKNYAQIELEGLAIVFGVTQFHKYVHGRYQLFKQTTNHLLVCSKRTISITFDGNLVHRTQMRMVSANYL